MKLQYNPKKHESNGAGWEIAKHIKNEPLKAIKLVVQNFNFVFLTGDEVTTMDNVSWASVHGYSCVGLVLDTIIELNVQQMFYGSYVNSLTLLLS